MKKIINLLLIVFLTLISIQCRVENLEPSSLKKYNEKSRLDYLKIDRPITYKSNAYFADVSKQGKIEFLNKKEIYIEGNATVTALNKNVKLRRDVVIPNNSIVYVKVDSLDKTVTLELTNGSKFNVGFKYDYYLSDPEKGIKDSKFAVPNSGLITNLSPNTDYYIQIVWLAPDGRIKAGSYSVRLSAKTLDIPPITPTLNTPTASADGTNITLGWKTTSTNSETIEIAWGETNTFEKAAIKVKASVGSTTISKGLEQCKN